MKGYSTNIRLTDDELKFLQELVNDKLKRLVKVANPTLQERHDTEDLYSIKEKLKG